ncbi:MAG TPA: hypothetical protein PLV92_26170, partial [Pirellulaceae bacterium]|nr:hypothetical protein [Pirellulaceae bacterium]
MSTKPIDSRGNSVTLDSRLGITLTGGADTLESSTNGGTLTLRSSQATDALQFGGAAVTTWYMSDASLEAVGCGFDTIVFGADATVTAGVVDPSGKVTVSGAPQSYNADLVIWGNGTGSGIDILTSIDTLECGPEAHSITLNAKKLALVSNDITLGGDLSTYGGAVTASGDELTVSAGATRTIDSGATGGGPAPTTAGGIDLSGMASIRGSTASAELSLKARGGVNGADVLLAGATTGTGGVSQLSLLEVSNWDASGARVVSLGPVNLASTATSASSVQINFGASSTSFVRINGAIDISSNVAAMSGGSFDASIARLIPYAANTELKIDSSATLTGGGGDFGGFVRFGSIVGTTIGASTEYFNGVDIDTRGDTGNGSLVITSTGTGFPKIEVDGELTTAADHQAVILAGSISMP